MRPIDADALKIDYGFTWSDITPTHDELYELIDRQPTIDAVPVVRCRECRWGKEVCGNIECSTDPNVPPEYHSYDWFCPNGEPKE